MKSTSILSIASLFASASGYAFVTPSQNQQQLTTSATTQSTPASSKSTRSSSTTLQMIDQSILMGGGVALAGLGVGIGLVAFTEQAGERGSGLSESMATSITGGLMEDVEVSSVSDLGGLTAQLENALKESGGVDGKVIKDMELTEEEKQKIIEDQDDGW